MAVKRIIILLLACTGISWLWAAPAQPSVADKVIVYKQMDTVVLKLHQYLPADFDSTKTYKAVLFFHGGGWRSGSYKAFNRQARYLAKRGMMAFSADYRIYNVHKTSPFDATEDASEAFQYLLDYAGELNIDPDQIVVGGGSAGGHLAITTSFWKEREIGPTALLLFNPVLDTGPGGFGFKRMEGRYLEISPIDHIAANHPPTLILVGTKDKVLPVDLAERYQKGVENEGGRCDVIFYKGEEHAFFNQPKYVVRTMAEVDKFLVSLNLLTSSE